MVDLSPFKSPLVDYGWTSEFSSLPQLALEAIAGHLSPRDFINARLVCSQWRDGLGLQTRAVTYPLANAKDVVAKLDTLIRKSPRIRLLQLLVNVQPPDLDTSQLLGKVATCIAPIRNSLNSAKPGIEELQLHIRGVPLSRAVSLPSGFLQQLSCLTSISSLVLSGDAVELQPPDLKVLSVLTALTRLHAPACIIRPPHLHLLTQCRHLKSLCFALAKGKNTQQEVEHRGLLIAFVSNMHWLKSLGLVGSPLRFTTAIEAFAACPGLQTLVVHPFSAAQPHWDSTTLRLERAKWPSRGSTSDIVLRHESSVKPAAHPHWPLMEVKVLQLGGDHKPSSNSQGGITVTEAGLLCQVRLASFCSYGMVDACSTANLECLSLDLTDSCPATLSQLAEGLAYRLQQLRRTLRSITVRGTNLRVLEAIAAAELPHLTRFRVEDSGAMAADMAKAGDEATPLSKLTGVEHLSLRLGTSADNLVILSELKHLTKLQELELYTGQRLDFQGPRTPLTLLPAANLRTLKLVRVRVDSKDLPWLPVIQIPDGRLAQGRSTPADGSGDGAVPMAIEDAGTPAATPASSAKPSPCMTPEKANTPGHSITNGESCGSFPIWFPNLRNLTLVYCSLPSLMVFGHCPELTSVAIQSCPVPMYFAQLGVHWPQLRSLSICHNELLCLWRDDDLLSAVLSFQQLKRLALLVPYACRFSHTGIVEMVRAAGAHGLSDLRVILPEVMIRMPEHNAVPEEDVALVLLRTLEPFQALSVDGSSAAAAAAPPAAGVDGGAAAAAPPAAAAAAAEGQVNVQELLDLDEADELAEAIAQFRIAASQQEGPGPEETSAAAPMDINFAVEEGAASDAPPASLLEASRMSVDDLTGLVAAEPDVTASISEPLQIDSGDGEAKEQQGPKLGCLELALKTTVMEAASRTWLNNLQMCSRLARGIISMNMPGTEVMVHMLPFMSALRGDTTEKELAKLFWWP